MKLENLSPAKGAVRNNTRLGRGQGSGGGGTAKRGHNGAKARAGYSSKRGFEGGQMPLQRRVPKFGFNNINRVEYKAINLDTIQALVDKTGTTNINIDFLRKNGLISKFDLVKVLGRGELKSAVNIESNGFSASAVSIIEKLGGKTTVVSKYKLSAEVSEPAKKVVKKVVAVAPVIESIVEPVSEVAKTEFKEAIEVVEVTPEVIDVASIDVVEPTPVKEVQVKVKKSASTGDDLKKIEGIGPKIAEVLTNAGVSTFTLLSESNTETLKTILSEASGNFGGHDPSTWPQQATLAAAGKWDELKELQDRLSGGRA
jgi:large subunit ribosomal protein L15